MRLFGYCRVSTERQAKTDDKGEYVGSLKIQRDLLIQHGVEPHRIVTDIGTGANFERQGISELLLKMESGDRLLVPKLDRLGRNTLEMLELIDKFDKSNISIEFISDGISTGGEMGKMVVTILSAVATSERARILERTNEGRLEAKERGVKFGRKVKVDAEKVKCLKDDGLNHSQIAEKLKISRASVIRALRKYSLEG